MVLLKVAASQVRVRGASIGCDVALTIPAEVERIGEAAADASILRALVGSLGGSRVLVNEAEKNVTLRSGSARRRLPKFVAEEFPAETPSENNGRALDWNVLGGYLDRVLFACAAEGETSMPVLTGVCMDWSNGFILATDRKKMVVQELDIGDVVLGSVTTLPANELKKLKAVAGFSDGSSVSISKAGAKVRFSFGQGELVVNGLMGAFPTQMVSELSKRSEDAVLSCSVPLNDFKRVGGAMRAMTRSSAMRFPMHVGFDGDSMLVSLNVADVGELEERIQILNADIHEEIELMLDAREMAEIARHLEGETFDLFIQSRRHPVRISASAMSGWSLYLMPMVTREDIESNGEIDDDF
jgi:DNA polymerase III sliding clamp (beta) subunit (PCNA family)